MIYQVQITQIASEQIDEAYAWLVERTPLHAPGWHEGLLKAIGSLEAFPIRCPLVPEEEDSTGGARQLLYGNKHHAYRIIFEVHKNIVTILQVRHAARRFG